MYEVSSLVHSKSLVGLRVFSSIDLSKVFDIDINVVRSLSNFEPDSGKYIILEDHDGYLISRSEHDGTLVVEDVSSNTNLVQSILSRLKGYKVGNLPLGYTVPSSCFMRLHTSKSVPYILDSTLTSVILSLLRGLHFDLIASIHDIPHKAVRAIAKDCGMSYQFSKLSDATVTSLRDGLFESPQIIDLCTEFFVSLPVVLSVASNFNIIVSANQLPLSLQDSLRQGVSNGLSVKDLSSVLGLSSAFISSLVGDYILDRDISLLPFRVQEQLKRNLSSGLNVSSVAKTFGVDKKLVRRIGETSGVLKAKMRSISTKEDVKNSLFHVTSLETISKNARISLSEVKGVASEFNIISSTSDLPDEVRESIIELILKKVKGEDIALHCNTALCVVKDVYTEFKLTKTSGRVWISTAKKQSILEDLFSVPVFSTIAVNNGVSDKTVMRVAEEFSVTINENDLSARTLTSLLSAIQSDNSLAGIAKEYNVSARVVITLKNEIVTDMARKDLNSGDSVYDVSFKHSLSVSKVKKLLEELN